MTKQISRRRSAAYTLVEVLVVVLILLVLTNFALPSYISTVYTSRMGTANANARAIATAVQGRAITANAYDTTLADYTTDLGGQLPLNPCTNTRTGYTITSTATTASIVASAGTNCGTWTPKTFSVTL